MDEKMDKKISKNCQKIVKSCQKNVIFFLSSCQKVGKQLVKILKRRKGR
jgi:hypothetical protein